MEKKQLKAAEEAAQALEAAEARAKAAAELAAQVSASPCPGPWVAQHAAKPDFLQSGFNESDCVAGLAGACVAVPMAVAMTAAHLWL